MDEFFKRITKHEPFFKNFEAEVTPSSPQTAPAPSSTPDVAVTTEKSTPVAEQVAEQIAEQSRKAQIVKDDAGHSTPIHVVDSEVKETEKFGFGFFEADQEEPEVENLIVEKREEAKVENVIVAKVEEESKEEKESSSNELVKMLEQAGETTDFLS